MGVLDVSAVMEPIVSAYPTHAGILIDTILLTNCEPGVYKASVNISISPSLLLLDACNERKS